MSVPDQPFEALFRLADQLLAVADLEGRLTRVNPAWEDLLDRPIAQIEGSLLADLVVSHDIARVEDVFAQLERSATPLKLVASFARPDGSRSSAAFKLTTTLAEEWVLVIGSVRSTVSESAPVELPGPLLDALTGDHLDLQFITDANLRLLWSSPSCEQHLGHAVGALRGRSFYALLPVDKRPIFDAIRERGERVPGGSTRSRLPLVGHNGQAFDFETWLTPLSGSGTHEMLLIVARPTMPRADESWLGSCLPLPDQQRATFTLDTAADQLVFSQSWQQIVEERSTALTLKRNEFLQRVHAADRRRVERQLRRVQEGTSDAVVVQFRIGTADKQRWVVIESARRSGSPHIGGALTAAWRNSSDPLTGLPNRVALAHMLAKRLRAEQARQATAPSARFALLLIDIDRFHVLNDSLGQHFGDRLLQHVAERIRNVLGDGDLIFRVGPDEFGVLMVDLRDEAQAERCATQIQRAVRPACVIGDTTVFVTASIGIAVNNRDFQDGGEMLRAASLARNRSKSRGPARTATYQSEMSMQAISLFQLGADLRLAVDQRQFSLHFQPIVSLDDRRLVEVEALIRWNHPARGMVYPGEFIAYAEEHELIQPISWWVLHAACRQLRNWSENHADFRSVGVCVNISRKLLESDELIEHVDRALHDSELDPERLTLEITESAIMENAESAAVVLKQLRDRGVRLAIDDFGTGFSSLSYLFRFPVSTLKIDRSFVRRLHDGESNREIVRTILLLARNMRMQAIVEGVENRSDLDVLRGLDCHLAQGFYFSRPGPPETIHMRYATEPGATS
ncbi:MAG: GGDEF domain-containing protein [Myxococcales bacterium]|nr:GGDEF domain-containing protein [Myxococcales bacterium]